jgi:hypothetical protein
MMDRCRGCVERVLDLLRPMTHTMVVMIVMAHAMRVSVGNSRSQNSESEAGGSQNPDDAVHTGFSVVIGQRASCCLFNGIDEPIVHNPNHC